MKKIISLMIVFVLMFSVSVTTFASNDICVVLDGRCLDFDVLPQIINGRTMVPIRAIFEEMGATVEWYDDSKSAVCTKGDTVVVMMVDSLYMYINNQIVGMDIAPVIIDGRTLAPARYVAEAFGADVQWDQANNTVIINTGVVERTVVLYAMDGRTIEVYESEVPAYLNVGWYSTLAETQQTMYAPDGRTLVVFKAEVPAYKNVGWYETRSQAQAANMPASGTSASVSTSTSGNHAPDGYYYRTPTGKRWHLDPDCGGKNSYRTTDISGLTPCAKCAK